MVWVMAPQYLVRLGSGGVVAVHVDPADHAGCVGDDDGRQRLSCSMTTRTSAVRERISSLSTREL
jgi:hypothetical protein